MKDYFSGIEFGGKTEINTALNRLSEIATLFIADKTARECLEALHDYNIAAIMCAFFEGLYYASLTYLVDAHVFLEASISMVHYKYFHMELNQGGHPGGDA